MQEFLSPLPSLPWLDVDLGIGFWGFESLHWALGSVTGEASQELPQCELLTLKGPWEHGNNNFT